MPTVTSHGKTIVPGLWDMHTHVTQVEWAPVYLAAGVTTVRDMGNEFEFIMPLRDAIASDAPLGPRILLAGLVDGGGPNAFGVYYAATPEEAKPAVTKYHDAGFQQIKIYSLITPPIVEAICAEAHRLGMTVTGHVPNGMTIEQAAAAGMDQIAHLAIRGEAGSDEVNTTIAFLRDHKTVIDPTQSWNELLGHAAGHADRGVSAWRGEDSGAAQPRVLERRRRRHRRRDGAGASRARPADREGAPRRRRAGCRRHRRRDSRTQRPPRDRAVRRGGADADAGAAGGDDRAARAMKIDAELGTIERGKRADMVVLNANPLESIRNIRSVRWTISDGRVYDAPALWKSVRFQP